MKISRTQLKQIIKEELERELMDEAQSLAPFKMTRDAVAKEFEDGFIKAVAPFKSRFSGGEEASDINTLKYIFRMEKMKDEIIKALDFALFSAFRIVQGKDKNWNSIKDASNRIVKDLESIRNSAVSELGRLPKNQRPSQTYALIIAIMQAIGEEMFINTGDMPKPRPELVTRLSKIRKNTGVMDRLKGFFGVSADEEVMNDIRAAIYVWMYIMDPVVNALEVKANKESDGWRGMVQGAMQKAYAAQKRREAFIDSHKLSSVDQLIQLMMKDDPKLMSGDSNK